MPRAGSGRELGEPIAEVPRVYEMAVYCDFPEPPQIRVETPEPMLETKLQAILAYASQEQIGDARGHPAGHRAGRVSPRIEVPLLRSPAIRRAFREDDLMPGKICYLGDDHLQGAAAYLAGILLHYGLAFDYVPSAESPPADFAATPYAAYVISDYPAARLGEAAMTAHCSPRGARGRPGDARRLGELSRAAGRVSPVAAGRRSAGDDAVVRRPPQFRPALPDRKGGRPRDPGGSSLGPAAGDRRHQRGDGQARGRNAVGRGRSSPFGSHARQGFPVQLPSAAGPRCWSSAGMARAGRRPWPPTWRRTGSAVSWIGATSASCRRSAAA